MIPSGGSTWNAYGHVSGYQQNSMPARNVMYDSARQQCAVQTMGPPAQQQHARKATTNLSPRLKEKEDVSARQYKPDTESTPQDTVLERLVKRYSNTGDFGTLAHAPPHATDTANAPAHVPRQSPSVTDTFNSEQPAHGHKNITASKGHVQLPEVVLSPPGKHRTSGPNEGGRNAYSVNSARAFNAPVGRFQNLADGLGYDAENDHQASLNHDRMPAGANHYLDLTQVIQSKLHAAEARLGYPHDAMPEAPIVPAEQYQLRIHQTAADAMNSGEWQNLLVNGDGSYQKLQPWTPEWIQSRGYIRAWLEYQVHEDEDLSDTRNLPGVRQHTYYNEIYITQLKNLQDRKKTKRGRCLRWADDDDLPDHHKLPATPRKPLAPEGNMDMRRGSERRRENAHASTPMDVSSRVYQASSRYDSQSAGSNTSKETANTLPHAYGTSARSYVAFAEQHGGLDAENGHDALSIRAHTLPADFRPPTPRGGQGGRGEGGEVEGINTPNRTLLQNFSSSIGDNSGRTSNLPDERMMMSNPGQADHKDFVNLQPVSRDADQIRAVGLYDTQRHHFRLARPWIWTREGKSSQKISRARLDLSMLPTPISAASTSLSTASNPIDKTQEGEEDDRIYGLASAASQLRLGGSEVGWAAGRWSHLSEDDKSGRESTAGASDWSPLAVLNF